MRITRTHVGMGVQQCTISDGRTYAAISMRKIGPFRDTGCELPCYVTYKNSEGMLCGSAFIPINGTTIGWDLWYRQNAPPMLNVAETYLRSMAKPYR